MVPELRLEMRAPDRRCREEKVGRGKKRFRNKNDWLITKTRFTAQNHNDFMLNGPILCKRGVLLGLDGLVELGKMSRCAPRKSRLEADDAAEVVQSRNACLRSAACERP